MPGFFLSDGQAYQTALIRRNGVYTLQDGTPASIPAEMTLAVKGGSVWMHLAGRTVEFVFQDMITHYAEEAGPAGADVLRAPMPGSVVAIQVAPGDIVALNDGLLVITSMKMEMQMRAPRAGRIASVHVAIGGGFERDAILITLEDAS